MTAAGVQGTYFPPRSSKGTPAQIVRDGTGLALRTKTGTLPIGMDAVEVSGRIGNTPRRIYFPDQSLFETADNDGVDALLYGDQPNAPSVLLARMENIRGRLWLLVVIVTAFVIGAAGWAFPAMTNFASDFISPEWEARLGRESMSAFDGYLFTASQLDLRRQAAIRKMFDQLVAQVNASQDEPLPYDYELVFRNGGVIGANALALPGGTIIVTDELVELAPSDDAVASVLAHELGHVVGRHAIKLYAYNQGLHVIVLLMGGSDPSSFGVAANMTALLLEHGYSRDFEREADSYAIELMQETGRPPEALADMFEALSKECAPNCDRLGWLSTHPGFAERIEAARAAGKHPE